MNDLSAYLAMGGYGAYIWPSYGLAFVVMAGLALTSWRSLRRNEADLAALQQQRPARRRKNASGPSSAA